jgi:hypothetical protein
MPRLIDPARRDRYITCALISDWQMAVSMNASSTMKRANCSCAIVVLMLAAGCRSSSYAQRGTTCAVSGAAVGTSLDDIDARNRADIAAQLGRPVAPGPATPAEVAAMTQAGVDPRFIISYINRSTNISPITAQDVIYLHDQGVNEQVIQAMLTPGAAFSRSEVARTMPPRVFIIEDPWAPYYYPHYGFAYGCGYRCY